ncbi:MAG: DNA polymerase III subunit delta, partial [Phycisphaeraceae bacterium]
LLLTGPEQMVKQQLLDELRDELQKKHGELQTMMHDGRTATLADVLDDLRTFSLMQQYKLVIVDEADQFVTKQTRPALERYAQSPVDHATLVLRSVKWDSPRLDKLIAKVGRKIKCEPLKGAALKKWLADQSRDVHDRQLTAQAAAALVDRIGSDMTQLNSELAKLAVLVGPGDPIRLDLIDDVVGRDSDEQAWAVQEAVLAVMQDESDCATGGRAIEKIHELVDLSGQPATLVGYFVADLMRKLYLALMMKRQGVSAGQIGKELKLWGPRLTMFMTLLRRLDDRSAGWLYDRIIDLDMRAKSGRGEPMRNLECFCAALADEVNRRRTAT